MFNGTNLTLNSDVDQDTRHRGYLGTGIMEGDCTHNPEDDTKSGKHLAILLLF